MVYRKLFIIKSPKETRAQIEEEDVCSGMFPQGYKQKGLMFWFDVEVFRKGTKMWMPADYGSSNTYNAFLLTNKEDAFAFRLNLSPDSCLYPNSEELKKNIRLVHNGYKKDRRMLKALEGETGFTFRLEDMGWLQLPDGEEYI